MKVAIIVYLAIAALHFAITVWARWPIIRHRTLMCQSRGLDVGLLVRVVAIEFGGLCVQRFDMADRMVLARAPIVSSSLSAMAV
jgi:hypothetical protein